MIWAEDENAAQAIILEALKKGLASLGIDYLMYPDEIEVTDLGLEKCYGTRKNAVKKNNQGHEQDS